MLRHTGNNLRTRLFDIPGIDIKTHTGFIVVAPSENYALVTELVAPEDLPVLPQSWEDHLKRKPMARRKAPRAKSSGRAISGVRPQTAPWAQTALDREIDLVTNARRGDREQAFNTAAFNLGQIIGSGDLDRAEVEQQLETACRANRYIHDHNDFHRKLKKSIEDGMAQPRHTSHVGTRQIVADVEFVDSLDPNESGEESFDEDDTPRLASRLLTRSDLRALPKPEPLIDSVLDRGAVDLLYGRHSSAKTFLALDWAASVATGRKWQGNNTTQCRVLYVVAEGAFGFDTRVDAWECGWHTTISDDVLSVMPLPVNLTRKGEVHELAQLIEWGGYEFVVLDTLARCMVGAEENSAKDVGVVVDAMNTLRQATPGDGRGVILGLHHAGKDGKTMRGSSAFESAADTVYFASRDEDNVISVLREKRRDGPQHDLHTLRLDLIDGTGSGVLSAINLSDSALSAADTANTSAAKLMSTFMSAFGHVGASKAELRNVANLSPATFHRSVNKLVELKQLVNTGSEQRPFYVAGQQS